MNYSFEVIVDGLCRYIDSEIITHMNDLQEIVARLAIGRVVDNQESIKKDLVSNGIIRSFGVIDSEGCVDVERLSRDLQREIEKKEKISVSIPLIGKVTFKSQDIDRIRQYITGEI
jgi:hypothetical protein